MKVGEKIKETLSRIATDISSAKRDEWKEIQSALQATITKAIFEGSIEPGNVTIFNIISCI